MVFEVTTSVLMYKKGKFVKATAHWSQLDSYSHSSIHVSYPRKAKLRNSVRGWSFSIGLLLSNKLLKGFVHFESAFLGSGHLCSVVPYFANFCCAYFF